MVDSAERVDSTESSRSKMASRVSHAGLIIVGLLALVLTINAALDSDFVGAGILAGASALAFGFLGHRIGGD
jgi:hypothetical protein